MKKLLICLYICLIMCGCNDKELLDNNNNPQVDTVISYSEAKTLVDEGAIIIDVRNNYEYNQRHIEGAILLPVDNINDDAVSEVISSKDTVIIVYCESGNRSSRATKTLKELGYKNVYDLGSINNWEE